LVKVFFLQKILKLFTALILLHYKKNESSPNEQELKTLSRRFEEPNISLKALAAESIVEEVTTPLFVQNIFSQELV
jgi:hypothetical protein